MLALPACSTLQRPPPSIIKVEAKIKPPPAEALKPCAAPASFSDVVPADTFEAMDGQGKVNAILEYVTVQVFGALGECNARHNALVVYVSEIR